MRIRAAAFTLIELMVAMAIFAVLSALAYGVLNQTLLNAEILSERMDRLRGIQKTVRVISDDFMQLAPRPVRNEFGEGFSAALTTNLQSVYAIELTRGGWNNLIVLPRSTLQRVAYRVEENELIRYHWNVLDRTLSNEPAAVTLIDGVESIVFRFLQTNGEWTEVWPPANSAGPTGFKLRPRAVELVLTLQGEGELTRLIEVAP
jgi:general secretion pathway protein J